MQPDPEISLGALLRRLALPALFVGAVAYTQLTWDGGGPTEPVGDAGAGGPTGEAPPAFSTTELSGPTMGTDFTVKVRGPELDAPATEALVEAIQGALDDVNDRMSTWQETSELSRFNAAPAGQPFPLSPPTLEVLAASEAVYRASGGVFDVTVGPLVRRWGFGPDEPGAFPAEDELQALLARVGQDKLRVDGDVAIKALPGLSVDLSAVAKGYAVDRVAEAVEALGYASYMVEVGGEVRVGAPGPGGPWKIAVERPEMGRGGVFEVVHLERRSMATSGDYRNFRVDGETLRSHTIDPRTGYPVEHALASVTVLHPRCALADAWATALMVLGPDEGLSVAEREGLAAMFIVRGEAGLERRATAAFESLAVRPDQR